MKPRFYNLGPVTYSNQGAPKVDGLVGCYILCTVKWENLAPTIFGGFSNIQIWQIINLAISNFGIFKDYDVFIWWRLILVIFKNSPISPNKSSPIINCFTVVEYHIYQHRICMMHMQIHLSGIYILTSLWFYIFQACSFLLSHPESMSYDDFYAACILLLGAGSKADKSQTHKFTLLVCLSPWIFTD